MGKKPIKRSPEIMPLSREHHFSLLFSWKINLGLKKELPVERIVRYVTYFWENNLRLHFEQEEAVLFQLFPDDPLVRQALAEHGIVREMISGLQAGLGSEAGQRTCLKSLSDLITSHVRMEERVLFPDLERRMSKDALGEAAKALAAMHSGPVLDDYDDEFWVN